MANPVFGMANAAAAAKAATAAQPFNLGAIFWHFFWPLMAIFGVSAALVLILRWKHKREEFKNALDMVLLSVRVPPKTAEEVQQSGKQQEKDWIKVMEDFYANLVSLKPKGFLGSKPWIVLEVAKVRGDICFFVAAPKKYAGFIEKKINSIYPDAQVEKSGDFNIFGHKEEVCAGFLKTMRPVYLPIKTYSAIEIDPLSSITNTLTKLEEREEAAVQIAVRNGSDNWHQRGREVLKLMKKGKDFRTAHRETSALHNLVGGKAEEDVPQAPMQQNDDEAIKGIEAKLSRHSFETNARIVVSIKDPVRSEEVFNQLAAAFDQFSAPDLNHFHIFAKRGRAARPVLDDFIFRKFNDRQVSVLSAEELASIYHLPTPFLKTPNVKTMGSKNAPAPSNLLREGLLMGYNMYRGAKKDAYLGISDRRRHLYVIGQTGTGKSAFLSNLIEQDVMAGNGVGILDPHGDLIDDIMGKIPNERVDDVVVFDPSSMEYSIGLNMLEYDPKFPEQKTFIINEFMKIFDKLYDLKSTGGPMFEQYARNALQLLMDDPNETYTLMEVPKVLSDKEFRHYLLAKCRNILVKEFWEKQAEAAGGEASLKNMVPYITSKFDTFISNDYMRPIIGQVKSTFKFREILDQKKIFLVNLSKGRLGDINSSLLGLIITSKLTIAAFSRVDTAEADRKDFYLYIDEFQNFATDTISTILSEARKYKLCLTISHQFIGQLEEKIRDSVFGNVGTVSSFRVGVEDSEFLAKQFAPVFNAQDLNRLENYNAYVRLLIDGQVSLPFNIKTYPPSKSDRERSANIREYYLLKEGRDREEVEFDINRRRQAYAAAAVAPAAKL
ncbi:MAG: DUF87 domain-containing protein [Candidatus Pacebacteria bacterium]|jgi:hypothetical protein|nr:DUF87 domain-containing protein [Candidatus Paceibacterota bacterium]